MKPSTIEMLIKKLKEDQIIKQKDITTEYITIDVVTTLRSKIKKRFKLVRYLTFITLTLILLTFIYVDSQVDSAISSIQYISRFWYIFMSSFIAITFASKEIWNSRRNLMILDIFEKELLD